MGLPPHLRLNTVKERRVKRAPGCRCELCGEAYPVDVLEIHLLPGNAGRAAPGPDLQREILVLCPPCHREIHAFRVPRQDQKALVRDRAPGARKEIRAVLGYNPQPYSPPDTIDLAALYDEARQIASPYVNGA